MLCMHRHHDLPETMTHLKPVDTNLLTQNMKESTVIYRVILSHPSAETRSVRAPAGGGTGLSDLEAYPDDSSRL